MGAAGRLCGSDAVTAWPRPRQGPASSSPRDTPLPEASPAPIRWPAPGHDPGQWTAPCSAPICNAASPTSCRCGPLPGPTC